ncbi:MAG: glycine oxidase ThiO [Planctomycetota bacterium]|nr:glycine oxidase ThiO [Planctomycetota bacterium]
MTQTLASDIVIIGGGVIGLSIAYELACRGQQVQVLERGKQLGREASWAGAGILPPANPNSALNPAEKLRGISHQLHPQWAERLQQESGIDTGFRRCGGIYLARKPGEAASLAGYISLLHQEGIEASKITKGQLLDLEPTLDPDQFHAAYLLPDELTLRNPRHVKALAKSCKLRGVQIHTQCEVLDIECSKGTINGLVTTTGSVTGQQYCITAGAWSSKLLKRITDIPTGIVPIRGQMILFEAPENLIHHVLNEGSRYLVPRADGKVLAGSCEEEVGFQKGTTPEMLEQLEDFAYSLVPALKEHEITMSWSGLRPGSFDGVPYIGKIPDVDNLFIAAGHFRSGIHLSTGTAVLMADLVEGKPSAVDLGHFGIIR